MAMKERVSFRGRLMGQGHEADCTVWATKVATPGGGVPAYAKYLVQDVSKALPEGDYQLFLSNGGTIALRHQGGHWLLRGY